MHLNFQIEYHTHWGERLRVAITTYHHGGKKRVSLHDMETQDGQLWHTEVLLSSGDAYAFSFYYAVWNDAQEVRTEWNAVERKFAVDKERTLYFTTHWRDMPLMNECYSSAYQNNVAHFQIQEPQITYYDKTIIFRVQAPQLKQGDVLALVGSQPCLGTWNARGALRMSRAGLNEWVLSISAENLYLPFEYKYVILKEDTGQLIAWEEGGNRLSPSSMIGHRQALAICDEELRMPRPNWKTAGVVIPVFSLRSTHSQGIGDFGDLKRMATWAGKVGLHMIQLLPIYDTTKEYTYADSYPYNCISIYALHPIYMDLSQLPAIQDKKYQKDFEQRCKKLNANPKLDYEAVCRLKFDHLRRLYVQEGAATRETPAYQAFYREHESWLLPYAAFCLLRDRHHTCDFHQWGKYAAYRNEDIRALAEKEADDIHFYIYLQFLLDHQLRETVSQARSHGVLLKGDIPIGISRNSVEVWTEPHYFYTDRQAGAPPDAFSRNGQNWSFPIYNWEEMAANGYRWWRERMRHMARYFDAYRIDHVLGFFRIWQIPEHCRHALNGSFYPSLPMTAREIEGYGFPFNAKLHATPCITDQTLELLFGYKAEHIRNKYLNTNGERYELKAEYRTQEDIINALEQAEKTEEKLLCDGLLRLTEQVLFVPDMDVPDVYHPRITAPEEPVFQTLSHEERQAFLHLYEDYFYHRHNEFWHTQAMKKLPPIIQATSMLVCAEDLGMIPDCVAPVMRDLHMLTLEIQSMPKTYGQAFARLKNNPYESVCTLFTHDMPTLRGWWEEDYDRAQKYFNEVLGHEGPAPKSLPATLCTEIVMQHLSCPSMICLLSLQDWLSIDERLRHPDPNSERINVPANANHYWRYRMHLTIEDLASDHLFAEQVRTLIHRSGRV